MSSWLLHVGIDTATRLFRAKPTRRLHQRAAANIFILWLFSCCGTVTFGRSPRPDFRVSHTLHPQICLVDLLLGQWHSADHGILELVEVCYLGHVPNLFIMHRTFTRLLSWLSCGASLCLPLAASRLERATLPLLSKAYTYTPSSVAWVLAYCDLNLWSYLSQCA